jgi:hypothetical protein
MVCQDIVDSLDNRDRIDAILIDFSKAFDLVPHGRLLMKIANSGVDARRVVWIREFPVGHTQRIRVSRVDHERKIRSRRQRTDIGKYFFVNRTIQDWNQLPAAVLGTLPCKPIP